MTLNIGQRLTEAMDRRKMKNVQLSQLTGISTVNICNYNKNKYSPKADNIAKLALALGVSEAWLLGIDFQAPINEATESSERDRVNRLLDKLDNDGLAQVSRYIEFVLLSGTK